MPSFRRLPGFLLLILLCGAAVPATAQDDILGVFFDTAGTSVFTTTTPFEAVTAYLIILDASDLAGVSGWECKVPVLLDGDEIAVAWELSGEALNVDQPPNFRVGLASPLPWAEAIVLATGTVFVPDPADQVWFYLRPTYPASLEDPPGVPVPCYASGADPELLIPLHGTSDCPGFAAAGINGDPAQNIPLPALLPTALDFWVVNVGEAGLLELRVGNNHAFAIGGEAVSTDNAFTLRQGSDPFETVEAYSVPAGGFITLEVQFAPDQDINYEAVIEFYQCGQLVDTVPVTGSGGMPVCVVNPVALDFGTVLVGDFVDSIVTVRNTGTGYLEGLATIAEPEFEVIASTAGNPFTLGAGEATDLTIRFTPPAKGVYAGTLNLGTGLCDEIPLSGVGEEPPPVCLVQPTLLDFGEVTTGDLDTLSFSVANTGGGTLSGEVPDGSGEFHVLDGNGPFALGGGETLAVQVQFAPTLPGPLTWVMDLAGICSTVTCSGTGVEPTPVCGLSTTLLDFGEVPIGFPETLPFTITNTGNGTLTGEVPDSSSTGEFLVPIGNGPFALGAGETLTVQVQFAPTVPDSQTWVMDLAGICSPVTCTGTGIEGEPSCALSTTHIDFGVVYIYSASSRHFFITNDGTGILVGDVTASGACFSLVQGAGPFQLGPGQQRLVRVQFHPEYQGTFNGTVNTGTPLCGEVTLEGIGEPYPHPQHDDNMLGIFFDEAGIVNYDNAPVGAPLSLYLCLLNCTDPCGVLGWECRIQVSPPEVYILAWNLRGEAINVSNPPEFTVGLASPLPWQQPIVLMEFVVGVFIPQPIEFYLLPTYNPSLPDLMAYASGCDPGELIPMNWPTGGPEYPVAAINGDCPAGIEAPAPAVASVTGGIELRWEYDESMADGCHVYRRQEGMAAERLTTSLVTGRNGRVEYTDVIFGLPDGTELYYCYALFGGQAEIARSEEIQITVTGIAPKVTSLRPSYPNPFNPVTHIVFELSRAGRVRVEIFDVAGRRVRTLVDESLPAAAHQRVWDGRDDAGRPAPSGTYYCRLQTAELTEHRKMTLLK